MMDRVPVDDPGFRWGRGVFETLVVRRGSAPFIGWHRESMLQAAAALGLDPSPLPPDLSPPGREGMWRWFLTPTGFYSHWEEGIPPAPASMSLGISPIRLSAASWEARHKTLSYLSRLQARETAPSDEVILLNERGEVTSAAMANLFLARGGRLRTPPVTAGCRAGVIRRWVIERSGCAVEEAPLLPEMLADADELFLTNCRIGICPVSSLESRTWSAHPLANELGRKLSEFSA